jgi:hypothetical protein
MTYINIIIPSTPRSSKYFVKVTFPHLSTITVHSFLLLLCNIPQFIRPNFIRMNKKSKFKHVTGIAYAKILQEEGNNIG